MIVVVRFEVMDFEREAIAYSYSAELPVKPAPRRDVAHFLASNGQGALVDAVVAYEGALDRAQREHFDGDARLDRQLDSERA